MIQSVKQIILTTCLVGLMCLTTGCTDSDFTINAQLDGTPDNMVTICYMGNQGLVTERMMVAQGNQLTFKGSSDDYTILWIWDAQRQLIAQMVVRNGDRLTVKSDGLRLPTLDIKGNKVTEQWMKFRKSNQEAIDNHDTNAINRQIEQHIAQHPDQLLSTVLLVAEYNQLDGNDKVKQLLQSIKPDARPDRLVSTLQYLIEQHRQPTGIIRSLTLYRHGKGIQDLELNAKPAALLFWSRYDTNRKTAIDSLHAMASRHGDNIIIADILVDTDTTQWTHNIKQTSTSWTHWWAPGGMMDAMLQSIAIERTPTIILTDSTSHIIQSITSL